jgi:hypothetical protein
MREQVQRDAAANIMETGELVTPQVLVEQYAMNEEGDRSGALLAIGDST